MALVKFGGGVIQMSGSIAGNTFARNRYGNYVRARTKPVNPTSPLQQQVRAAAGDAVGRWSSILTAAQRTAWNLYADSVIMKNRLGESVNLSGFNMYVRSNSLLIRSAFPPVDAGPTNFSLPDQDGLFAITISEATQDVSVVFDPLKVWNITDDGFMFIFLGRPQQNTINFFNGPWKIGTVLEGDTALPLTSPQTFTAPFVCTEGQHVWAYARIMDPDGRVSEKFRADTFCAA